MLLDRPGIIVENYMRTATPWEIEGPRLFHQLDALVATSESPAIPLACYEAFESGVPVVSTPREWPETERWPNVVPPEVLRTGKDTESLAAHLTSIRAHRSADFKMAALGPEMYPHLTLEHWIDENHRLAARLVGEPVAVV